MSSDEPAHVERRDRAAEDAVDDGLDAALEDPRARRHLHRVRPSLLSAKKLGRLVLYVSLFLGYGM